MKTIELENYNKCQHASTAAISRRLWEICFRYRGFAISEQNALILCLNLKNYRMCLKFEKRYNGMQFYNARLKVIADVAASTTIEGLEDRKICQVWGNCKGKIDCPE